MKRSNQPSRVNERRKVALEQVKRRIAEKKDEGFTKEEHAKRVAQAKEEKQILEARIR